MAGPAVASLVLAQAASGASPVTSLAITDPRGDSTIVQAESVPGLGAESVDILSATLRRDKRGAITLTLDVAGAARPGLPLAYRVSFDVDGCKVQVSAQGSGGRALTDCENRETGNVPLTVAQSRLTWRVPASTLPKGARATSTLTNFSARTVLTEGHDNYDATILDSAK